MTGPDPRVFQDMLNEALQSNINLRHAIYQKDDALADAQRTIEALRKVVERETEDSPGVAMEG